MKRNSSCPREPLDALVYAWWLWVKIVKAADESDQLSRLLDWLNRVRKILRIPYKRVNQEQMLSEIRKEYGGFRESIGPDW